MAKILASLGSILTVGFGIWHFFVPAHWNWYSYILPEAEELVLAVRAINIFFSLCLVLIGIANLLFIYVAPSRFPLLVMLGMSTILWAVRCTLQIVFPQGSVNPALQYGMLAAFLLILLCFLVSLLLVIFNRYPVG